MVFVVKVCTLDISSDEEVNQTYEDFQIFMKKLGRNQKKLNNKISDVSGRIEADNVRDVSQQSLVTTERIIRDACYWISSSPFENQKYFPILKQRHCYSRGNDCSHNGSLLDDRACNATSLKLL